MQSTNLPSKYLVPFAKNDGAKVELPVTTATAGRASQSLGFPPITGQPPEAGGLPPQLEDFNGAMNQPARIAWWSQLGGKFPFDNTFAADANIGGYPLGAELVSSDNTGTWLSLADNNVSNPDTGAGTTWAPARAYGAFALTGQTGGTVTPTPVQAMKRRITIAGALTSNLIVILPTWLYSWDITNSTSGAFTVTVKTAAGAGAVIPQNGAPTPVSGDGTNIAQLASNIAAATTGTQAAQFSQTTGRLLNVQVFQTAGTSTYVPTTGAITYEAEVIGGGGGGGGSQAVTGGQVSAGGGGGGGGYARKRGLISAITGATITVGAGGGAAGGVAGNPGGTSSIGAVISASGGGGGNLGVAATASGIPAGGSNGGVGSNGDINAVGGPGTYAFNTAIPISGFGGASQLGAGANGVSGTAGGQAAVTPGSGGSGGSIQSGGPSGGGAGKAGIVIIREYA